MQQIGRRLRWVLCLPTGDEVDAVRDPPAALAGQSGRAPGTNPQPEHLSRLPRPPDLQPRQPPSETTARAQGSSTPRLPLALPSTPTPPEPTTHAGSRRLARALRRLQEPDGPLWCVVCPRGDNLFLWDVQLYFVRGRNIPTSPVQSGLRRLGRDCVQLEIAFPPAYPRAAPDVRVTQPRLRTANVDGVFVRGGSLCLRMLHQWNPNISEVELLETLFHVIAAIPVEGDGEYTQQEYEAGKQTIRRDHGEWLASPPGPPAALGRPS